MAIPVNIEDLLNSKIVESTRIEFKSDFNPNAVIHTICAFANDIDNLGGGYIVIGVEANRGQKHRLSERNTGADGERLRYAAV